MALLFEHMQSLFSMISRLISTKPQEPKQYIGEQARFERIAKEVGFVSSNFPVFGRDIKTLTQEYIQQLSADDTALKLFLDTYKKYQNNWMRSAIMGVFPGEAMVRFEDRFNSGYIDAEYLSSLHDDKTDEIKKDGDGNLVFSGHIAIGPLRLMDYEHTIDSKGDTSIHNKACTADITDKSIDELVEDSTSLRRVVVLANIEQPSADLSGDDRVQIKAVHDRVKTAYQRIEAMARKESNGNLSKKLNEIKSELGLIEECVVSVPQVPHSKSYAKPYALGGCSLLPLGGIMYAEWVPKSQQLTCLTDHTLSMFGFKIGPTVEVVLFIASAMLLLWAAHSYSHNRDTEHQKGVSTFNAVCHTNDIR